MKYRYRVIVMPKKELLDPQGRAIKQVINDMGIEVDDVRVGKSVEVVINANSDKDATNIVERLAREMFSNPIIEDYIIERI